METKVIKNKVIFDSISPKIGVIEDIRNYIPVTDDVSQFFQVFIFNAKKTTAKELVNLKKLYSKHRYSPRFLFTNFNTQEEIYKHINTFLPGYKGIMFEKYSDIKEYCNDIYEVKDLDENGRWTGFDDYMTELRKESIKHCKIIPSTEKERQAEMFGIKKD